jgi:hypothetical protein
MYIGHLKKKKKISKTKQKQKTTTGNRSRNKAHIYCNGKQAAPAGENSEK